MINFLSYNIHALEQSFGQFYIHPWRISKSNSKVSRPLPLAIVSMDLVFSNLKLMKQMAILQTIAKTILSFKRTSHPFASNYGFNSLILLSLNQFLTTIKFFLPKSIHPTQSQCIYYLVTQKGFIPWNFLLIMAMTCRLDYRGNIMTCRLKYRVILDVAIKKTIAFTIPIALIPLHIDFTSVIMPQRNI